MAGGMACRIAAHRTAWRVVVRRANYSAFNGGRRTPSVYSEVRCPECRTAWRTKAAYVDELPDELPPCTGCGRGAGTTCRICGRPYCHSCLTDHHHEGYGTPAADTR